MGLREMRGKWQYRFRVQGHDVSVITALAATERNRKKALQLEAAHRQGIHEGRWGFRPLKPRAFSEALPEFFKWVDMQYQNSPASARRIRTSMSSCGVFFGKQMLSMIHPGDVELYKVWRLTERQELIAGKAVTVPPVRPVTLKHDLDNLSVMFQWAVKAEYARVNPLKEVSRPSDAGAKRERVLTLAEEKLYFTHAKGNLAKIARLILLQGLRPEEAMRIRKEDVDLDRGTLRIQHGKTAAARRMLRLTEEAKVILGRQMASWGPWAFPSPVKPGACITKLNLVHDRACRLSGLAFVLYDLRHTFATRMVEAGVDLVALKQILGHADIRVTMRYVHPNQAHQDSAMAIYDKLNEARRAKEVVQ